MSLDLRPGPTSSISMRRSEWRSVSADVLKRPVRWGAPLHSDRHVLLNYQLLSLTFQFAHRLSVSCDEISVLCIKIEPKRERFLAPDNCEYVLELLRRVVQNQQIV